MILFLNTCGFSSLSIESLNSDGQQLHQYQQDKQSSLTSNLTEEKKKTTTYEIGILMWQGYTGLYWLLGSQSSPS